MHWMVHLSSIYRWYRYSLVYRTARKKQNHLTTPKSTQLSVCRVGLLWCGPHLIWKFWVEKAERSIRSSSHRRNSGVIVLYCCGGRWCRWSRLGGWQPLWTPGSFSDFSDPIRHWPVEFDCLCLGQTLQDVSTIDQDFQFFLSNISFLLWDCQMTSRKASQRSNLKG